MLLVSVHLAVYVINGDSKNPSTVYIYDATAKSWSALQTTTTTPATMGGPQFDPTNFGGILDHDQRLLCLFQRGTLLARHGPTQSRDLHRHPLGRHSKTKLCIRAINGLVPAGDGARPELHPLLGRPRGSSWRRDNLCLSLLVPTTDDSIIRKLPSDTRPYGEPLPADRHDGSATYVIDVISNTTQTLAGPTTKDAAATYTASTSALVQLSSSGVISWMGINGTAWAMVKALPSSASFTSPTGASASGSATGIATASGSKASMTASGSGGSMGSASSGMKLGMSLGLPTLAFALALA